MKTNTIIINNYYKMCSIKPPLSCIYDIKKYKLLITVKALYYLMSIANYLEINMITFIHLSFIIFE